MPSLGALASIHVSLDVFFLEACSTLEGMVHRLVENSPPKIAKSYPEYMTVLYFSDFVWGYPLVIKHGYGEFPN